MLCRILLVMLRCGAVGTDHSVIGLSVGLGVILVYGGDGDRLDLGPVLRGDAITGWRTHVAEDHGEEDQPVVEPKDHHQKEDLEEEEENDGSGVDQHDEGQEGGDASVQHRGTNVDLEKCQQCNCQYAYLHTHCRLAFYDMSK